MFSRFWQEFFKNEDFANFSELCLQDYIRSIQMSPLGGTKKRDGQSRLEKSLTFWVTALYGLSQFFCFL